MKVFYIQEVLTSYRKPLVDALSSEYDLTVFAGMPANNSGFKSVTYKNSKKINAPCFYFFGKRFFFQKNIIKNIVFNKPESIIIAASTRNITYWLVLVLCSLLNIKVFSHGQGLYSKPNPSHMIKLAYKIISILTYKYIVYSYPSKKLTIQAGFNPKKVLVAENSMSFDVSAKKQIKSGDESGIIFIGRLRDNCKLEKLIEATKLLRSDDKNISLHVVGSGVLEKYYREKYNFEWLVFYGAVYDHQEILNISEQCRYACYPGGVGLSVVHFFSLKLPLIIHGTLINHGPEASYVKNNENGFFFDEMGGVDSLYEILKSAWSIPSNAYLILSKNAFLEYKRLNNPPLEVRFLKLIRCFT